ncbi:MAG: hypothetical protein WCG45_05950 [bacterium]
MIFSLGADPEFMIGNGDELKSAINFLPSKENSIKNCGNEFYYDNMLAEIAIKPSFNKKEAVENFEKSLRFLAKKVYPNKIGICSAAYFPWEEINCNQAKIASCNPEYSAYSLSVVRPSIELIEQKEDHYQFKTNLRTCGGHIHLGSEILEDGLAKINVVRMMYLFIAIPFLFFDLQNSKLRRSCYGLAGTHRVPSQKGRLEYRTLSNCWFRSPEYVELIYDLCDFVLDFVKKENHKKFWSFDESFDGEDVSKAHFCHGYDSKSLEECINNCDLEKAEKFMLIVENFLDKDLLIRIFRLMKKDVADFYESWDL